MSEVNETQSFGTGHLQNGDFNFPCSVNFLDDFVFEVVVCCSSLHLTIETEGAAHLQMLNMAGGFSSIR